MDMLITAKMIRDEVYIIGVSKRLLEIETMDGEEFEMQPIVGYY